MNAIEHRSPLVVSRQQNRRWLEAVLLCLLGGCGSVDDRPPLHPTQGSLLINGEAAEGALLVFHRVGGEPLDGRGTRPTATVGADGNFAITTYQEGDGAPAGQYRVGVLWFDDPDSNSPWDKLGGRFANPATANIHVTVEPQRDRLDPIGLEGVPILSRRPTGSVRDLDQVD